MKKLVFLLVFLLSCNYSYAQCTGGGCGGEVSTDGQSASGHIIEDEGVKVKQRRKLNFSGDTVTVTDSGGKTLVTISGGIPGGLDKYVQFNDGGVFGGDADFQWNKVTNLMTLGGTPAIVGETGSDLDISTSEGWNITFSPDMLSFTITAIGSTSHLDFTVANGSTLQVNSAGDDKNVQITHDDSDTVIKGSSGDVKIDGGVDGNEVIVAGLPIKIISAVDVDGVDNIFIGVNVGTANTEGDNNVFIGTGGTGADNTTGEGNVFIGFLAGSDNTTGKLNVAIGAVAGEQNVDGDGNFFLGGNSGFNNISGDNNVFLGQLAGFSSTSSDNIMIGQASGFTTTGGRNVLIGRESSSSQGAVTGTTSIGFRSNWLNTGAGGNTIIGYQAGIGLFAGTNTGIKNTYIGYEVAGSAAASLESDENVIIGYEAGEDISSGDGNVVIGFMAGEGWLTTQNNQLIVDNSDTTTPLLHGNFTKDATGFFKVQPNNTLVATFASTATILETDTFWVGAGSGLGYGSLYAHEATLNVDISTAGADTYVKLTGFTTGLLNNVTINSDAFNVTNTGVYKIAWQVSADSQGANLTYECDIFLNNVEQPDGSARRKFGAASDFGSFSGTAILDITDSGHDIDLRIKGVGTAVDIDLFNVSFNIIQIGGT